MTLKCVVPTGQDAPCFKDADGKPYPQAAQSGSQAGPSVAGTNSGGNAAKPSQGRTEYWVCHGQAEDVANYGFVSSQVFESRVPSPLTDEAQVALATKFANAFINALVSIFPGAGTKWPDEPKERLWHVSCDFFDTKEEAMNMHTQIQATDKPQNWPPATPTGADGIRRLD